MINIEKAKQQVAKNHYLINWESVLLQQNKTLIITCYNELLTLLEQEQPEQDRLGDSTIYTGGGASANSETSKTAEEILDKFYTDPVPFNGYLHIHQDTVLSAMREYAAQSHPSSVEPSKTAEEMRVEFYGADDARSYEHDEIFLMKSYAAQSRPSDAVECLDWMLKNGYYRSTMVIDHNLMKGWDNSVHQTKLVDTSQGVYEKFLQEKKGGEK